MDEITRSKLTVRARERGVLDNAPLFYVRDTRQVVGNCALWWAINGAGYTCELDQAGLYTTDEVKSMRRGIDEPYPREQVEALVIKHVRVEDLHHLKEA